MRFIALVTFLFVLAMLFFSTHLLEVIMFEKTDQRMDARWVEGMAVMRDGLPYTLNFGQQNLMIEWINATEEISLESWVTGIPLENFESLEIYQFSKSALHIVARKLSDHRLMLMFQDKVFVSKKPEEFIQVVNDAQKS